MLQYLTTNDIKDSQVLGELLEQVDESINQVSADSAYDSFECYQQILEQDAEPVIPLRPDAVERVESDDYPEISKRNQVVRKIDELGRTIWKQETAYHHSELAETAMLCLE